MKLECLKDKLRWAIGVAEKTTGKNLSLTALNYVLLETKNRQLKISSTNLDLGIELFVPAKIETDGRTLINPGVLGNFLNTIDSEKITIELIGNNLAISSPTNSSLFRTYPVDDFPGIPHHQPNETIALPLGVFLIGLRAVWYSSSISDIKPEISSVYIYQDGKELVFVATDSFRLAEKKVLLAKPPTINHKLIIPIKNIVEILKIFNEINSEEIQLGITEHQVSFATDTMFLTSRLIDGVFPDYRQIISPTSTTEAVLLKSELIRALKLSQIFSDRLNQINLKILPAEKLFEFNSKNTEVGETTTKIEATLTGESLEVSFNARYLLDSFQSLMADNVTLRGNGRNKPIIVQGVGDNTFTYLMMPLNRWPPNAGY